MIKEITNNGEFICEVSNNLIDKSQCDIGDLIVVKKENIYQIRKSEERQNILNDFQQFIRDPTHLPIYPETRHLINMVIAQINSNI